MKEEESKQLTGWGRLLSFEMLVAAAVGLIAWGALTTKVVAIDDKVKENQTHHSMELNEIRKEQAILTRSIYEIRSDVRSIKETQEIFQKQQEERGDKQDEILKILREK